MGGAYRLDVDYAKLKIGKKALRLIIPETRELPLARGVEVSETGAWRFVGTAPSAGWGPILESLGTKDRIAQWMYEATGNPWHFAGIPADTVEMAVMDLLRHGALPYSGADLIAVWDGAWFDDEPRLGAVAEGLRQACRANKMALVGGETPALKALLEVTFSADDAPVFAFAANGVITPPEREIVPRIRAGARIVGVTSSGPHANGYSLLKRVGWALPEKFLTPVPGGRAFGAEALEPTRSYVGLMEAVLAAGIKPLAFVPATGGGLGKLCADEGPFTYVVERWPAVVPPIFLFLLEVGVPLAECLSTFNWGIGAYFIMEEAAADALLAVGKNAGYELYDLGHVEDGLPKTIFQPEGGIELPPPGE